MTGIAKGGKGFSHEAPGGGTPEWYTPPWMFEDLDVDFDLDPCHPEEDLPWVRAREIHTKQDDGLARDWTGKSWWLNPPYGDQTAIWLAKGAATFRPRGIALVFARTDTDWFHASAVKADAILFLRKRIRFVGADGLEPRDERGNLKSPGAGSMLLAWGPDMVAALDRFRLLGGDRNQGHFVRGAYHDQTMFPDVQPLF